MISINVSDVAELSATITAARAGAFTTVLVLPDDMPYRDGDILETADRPELLALAAGVQVTAVYVVGLLVSRNPKILGTGIDSACVLAIYAGSLVILYFAR